VKKIQKPYAKTMGDDKERRERSKENLSEMMRKKIDNPVYRELYARRMQIVEPVYSNITYN